MRITLAELAKLAGVSHTTISLALGEKHEGRVGEATRDKILALAEKHGYRTNITAKGLVQGRTYRIAVCIQGHLQDYAIIGAYSLYERLTTFSRGIQDADYAMELVEVPSDLPPTQISRDFAQRHVDGFVFLMWSPEIIGKLLFSLREKQIPAVASGTTLDDNTVTWTDSDRYDAFEKATSSLISDGHKEIVLLDIDLGRYFKPKNDAFHNTIKQHHEKKIIGDVFRAKRTDFESALEVTRKALDVRPNTAAILLTDNFYAEAVLHILKQRGKTPGKDCRIIGFGDTILADRIRPKLSHYSLQISEQVEFGLSSLLHEIKSTTSCTPQQKLFPAKYVQRET